MARVVPATEARVRFGELMRDVVDRDEPVIVERGGTPQVVVLGIARYRRLCEAASRYVAGPSPVEQAVEVGVRIAARRQRLPMTPVEVVIREVREGRDDDTGPDLR